MQFLHYFLINLRAGFSQSISSVGAFIAFLIIWGLLIGTTVALTIFYGAIGFLCGLLICILYVTGTRHKERKQQHDELMEALKNQNK